MLKVKIVNKHYTLKFGYGVFRGLSKVYKLNSFSELGKHIDGLEFGKTEDLSFDQVDFIGNLVLCAVKNSDEGSDTSFSLDDVINNVVFKTPEKLADILAAFTESFPKDKSQRKKIPVPKK